MAAFLECVEDASHVVWTVKGEVGGNVPRFDLHAQVEVGFVDRRGEINRFQRT